MIEEEVGVVELVDGAKRATVLSSSEARGGELGRVSDYFRRRPSWLQRQLLGGADSQTMNV